ncbi:uncharacterized protein [Henckelia pumila]|uniref:uncharacterized protein n=1 Tax=Henckelia pumila TaxID=405737 RepID=UPI003C6E96C6
MTSFSKIPMFSKEDFDDWKIRMQAHLSALDDDMWFVITDGPLAITKVNTAIALSGGGPQYIEKPRIEWTTEDKKKANLDNVAKDILQKKTNYISVSTQKFDNIKMKPGESMTEFDERVSSIVIELNGLGKTYPNREVILKVIRGLPKEWDVKTMAMRESKDLNKLELHDLFANLKAYEFELQTREEDQSTSQLTKALTAVKIESPVKSEKTAEQLSSDAMSLFVKKFGKFIGRNQERSHRRNFQKKYSVEDPRSCFNCGKIGHFIADCPKPKNFDKRKSSRNDRHTSRQKHEALVSKDNKTKWAEIDSDSEESNGSSSSSDDEEKVKCLMANDHELPSTSEQVFDFSSEEFTREELIKALHDMANEYHQLSLAFNEVRAKQKDLQDNSTELSWEQSVEINCLETEIAVLRTENEQLKIDIKNLTTEKHNMDEIIRSWNKSSSLLTKMNDSQRPLHDKTGLGFGKTVETGESKQMNRKRFGVGFNPHETKVEIAKSPKQTNAYQPNPMRGNRNQYHNQRPVQKRYKNIKDIEKGKQHTVSQAHHIPLSRTSNLVHTYRNTETGKLVKVFQEAGMKEKKEESWYLDSGCSRHMTENDKLLSELVKYNGPTITFGDNSKGKTESDMKTLIKFDGTFSLANQFALKQVRSSFKNKGYNSSSRCLELLHMDLFGPIPVTSLGGMRQPNVSYFKIFGSKCYIHNNGKSHLTAFDAKSNEGIFLGYSSISKAYRVFNKRTLNVEESVHIVFGEDLINDVATNTHQLSDLFQEIQLDIDSQNESEDEVSPPIRTLQYPEPELVDSVVEDHNITQPIDGHQTHTVENIEEQHHETQDLHPHFEETEVNQDNMTNQDLETQVISGYHPNTRFKWS